MSGNGEDERGTPGELGVDANEEQTFKDDRRFMEHLMDYRKNYARPDYDTYFMNMAFLVATRSTCYRRNVGAVLVKEQRILSTGYNGAPRGVKDCMDLGYCIRKERGIPSGEQHQICRGVHAEQNAIANAAYFGVAINKATIYITESSCSICTKMLINCGVKKILYVRRYIDELSMSLLKESHIEVEKFTRMTTIDDFHSQ